jgi:hypothetical protein
LKLALCKQVNHSTQILAREICEGPRASPTPILLVHKNRPKKGPTSQESPTLG